MKKLVDRAADLLRRVLGHGDSTDQIDLRRIRAEFDPAFYLAQFEAGAHPADPFTHFLSIGWREGRDPNALFSVEEYLRSNPDVAAAGMNPLVHYVGFGRSERRTTTPSRHTSPMARWVDHTSRDQPETAADGESPEADEIAAEMDVAFYQAIAGVTFASPRDAALHYMRTGWHIALDPTPDFSTAAYLRLHPDVADSGQVPFLHYIRSGRFEGRIAVDAVNDVARILTETPDLAAIDADWSHGRSKTAVLPRHDGTRQIFEAMPPNASRLIFAFTHDDFMVERGGIQFCVAREKSMAEKRGVAHVVLHPVRPRPRLAPEGESPALFVTIGDKRIGPVHIDSLRDVARRYRDVMRIDLVIHALFGHAPEDVVSLGDAAGVEKLLAWLHDSSFLCPSFALQRNLVSFCGAPEVTSTACRMCLFGAERSTHLGRLANMLDHLPTHAIAPSQAAADIVLDRGNLRFDGVSVVPHVQLSDGAPEAQSLEGRTRVAFLGTPARYKGYHVFRDVVRRNLGRGDVEFLYFGSELHREPGIPTVPVDVSSDRPDAMVEALREAGVDFVIQWSQCVETFSFVTIEAMRAGAEVLTHPESGNVAALVAATGRGHVLKNQAELEAFLEPEALARATRRRRSIRRPRLDVTPSSLSFEILDLGEPAPGKADAAPPGWPALKGLR